MNVPAPIGAMPVGTLGTLSRLETAAVRALRLWFSGPEAQSLLSDVFERNFGPQGGPRYLGAFEHFLTDLLNGSTRPIMRHSLTCHSLGADERVYGGLLAAAADGRREDALVCALAFARPDHALALVAAAEGIGPVLERLSEPLEIAFAVDEDPAPTTATHTPAAGERRLH